ncbi:hypothetical protein FK216_10190 [Moraxellaceae bacterium AER2_44_116]|nr:hypothetical protein [Moraxellaceae bacterium]TQC97254.1 hypothetical protein FK216_10190 [Moraxellaceae bacterium AER2_44_116]
MAARIAATVEAYEIIVERTFSDFDDYWATVLGAPSLGAQLVAMPVDELMGFKGVIRSRLAIDATGRVVCSGRANGVRGRVG